MVLVVGMFTVKMPAVSQEMPPFDQLLTAIQDWVLESKTEQVAVYLQAEPLFAVVTYMPELVFS